MLKRVEEIKDLQEHLSSVTYELEQLIRLKLDVPNLKSFLKSLEKKEEKLYKELTTIKQNCNHHFKYVGHSHNDDEYECVNCEERDSR